MQGRLSLTKVLLLVWCWRYVGALLTPVTPSTPQRDIASLVSNNKNDQKQNLDEWIQQFTPYADMPLQHAVTLPPRAYTDPALFELETNLIFRPGWICVAHVAQIPKRGDYMTLDLLEERLLIVNNGNEIQVMSRVCTHRWASICEPGRGSCQKFTCPMHRWSFDLQGTCTGTPFMDDVADFNGNDHALPKFRSETIDGFVYVNLDGTAEPLAPQISDLTEWMKNWDTSTAQVFLEMEYECDFNWVSRCGALTHHNSYNTSA